MSWVDGLGPDPDRSAVELYWLPLGAGGHCVRWNGRVYESLLAALQRRGRRDLYHSALDIRVPEGRYVIELTPVPDENGAERGVVREGPVGSRWAGHLRTFRYELRRWLGGSISDIAYAVDSPRLLTEDTNVARRMLDLVPSAPTLVWGRDESRAGEMWNSNSIISWLVASSGLDVDSIAFPFRGRAPGWDAGVVVARRTERTGAQSPAPRTRPVLPAHCGPASSGSGSWSPRRTGAA